MRGLQVRRAARAQEGGIRRERPADGQQVVLSQLPQLADVHTEIVRRERVAKGQCHMQQRPHQLHIAVVHVHRFRMRFLRRQLQQEAGVGNPRQVGQRRADGRHQFSSDQLDPLGGIQIGWQHDVALGVLGELRRPFENVAARARHTEAVEKIAHRRALRQQQQARHSRQRVGLLVLRHQRQRAGETGMGTRRVVAGEQGAALRHQLIGRLARRRRQTGHDECEHGQDDLLNLH